MNDYLQKEYYRKFLSYIIISSILCASVLFFVEQILMVDYLTKTISKILLYTIAPIVYIKGIRKVGLKEGLNLNKINLKTIALGIGVGLIAAGALVGAYFICKALINMETIFLELSTKSKVTAENYLIVATYFTFGNSFLEEFFFRGFVFLNLYKMGYKKFAYIFSSALFALYHIGIFKTWFNLELILLCLVGLFVGGLIFNYADTKSDNFLNSWSIHILADVAISVIGFLYLFQ